MTHTFWLRPLYVRQRHRHRSFAGLGHQVHQSNHSYHPMDTNVCMCVCVCVWAGPHRIAHGHEFWLAHSADGAGQSVTASDQRGGCHTERCVQLACRWVCDGDGGEGYHERSGRSEDGTGQCGECRCRVVRPAQRGDGDLHIIVRRRRGLNRSPAPAPAPRTGRRTAAAP
jgi:hypothetical protein